MTMNLHGEHLFVFSQTFGINQPIKSESPQDIVAVCRPLLSADKLLDMLETRNYIVVSRSWLSKEIVAVLHCYPKPVLAENVISTVKLIRVLTGCGLREAKDAFDTFMENF